MGRERIYYMVRSGDSEFPPAMDPKVAMIERYSATMLPSATMLALALSVFEIVSLRS